MNEEEIKTKKRNIIGKIIVDFYNQLNKSLKSFLVILFIGIQIALLVSYIYFIYRDKIGAAEGIRDTLSYQGKITNTDGVPPPDGQYNMRFRIYDQVTNGTLLWTETWNGTSQGIAGSKVDISEGVFNVELNSLCGNWVGSCAASGGVTFKNDSFYLQVEMDYNGDGTFEEIFAPRKRFTATPYAMNADKLDGRDSTEFVLKEGDTMTGTLSTPKIVENSIIAFYQFDNDANDSSPNGLNGTLQNSAVVSNDVLELNGTDQYVAVPDNNLLSFGNSTADLPFSISAWVNMTEVSNFAIISKTGEYQFQTDSLDKVSFQLFDDSVGSTNIGRSYNTALTDYEGKWLNLAATYDGSGTSVGIKIYLNGVEVDDTNSENNAASYVAMENLTNDLLIGKNSTDFAKGKFDDLKIYKRILSADEIKRLYDSQIRNQVQTNEITTNKISFEASVSGQKEGGYLSWDKAHNRLKFNSELYAPNIMPYFNNSEQDRDYTYYTDANKKLAYDFSDSIGSKVTDLAGNANGTVNGNADWTNLGYIGYGMKFGPDGDSVSFVNPGLSSTQGSVELWLKFNNITTAADNYVIRMSENSSNEIVLAKENIKDFYFKVGNSGKISLGNVPDTNWHHIVLTWNSGTYELFGDGQSVSTGSYSSLDVSRFDKFYLGSSGSTNSSLDGEIDSVAIYDDDLSAAEVKNHYKSAFENLYVSGNLSNGSETATLSSLMGLPASIEKSPNDPVYFYNAKKVVGLAFSEGSGTTTTNITGTDNPTINGATWVKGYYDYGLAFNGSADYLNMADSVNLNMGTSNFSIEFFIKADAIDQTNKRIISKTSSNAGYEVFFDSNNKINLFIGDGTNTFISSITGGTALNDGKWHHVAISINRAGNATIFYDTVPIYIANVTSVSGSLDNTADLYIGKDSTANYFQGSLDSVLIYNDFQLDLSDIINRRTNGPGTLAITSRGGLSGLASLMVLNNSGEGDGTITAILDSSNTSGYPLKVWNQASSTSGSDTIFNLISFGSFSENYGNLIWDATNTQFIFDQSVKTNGDLTSDYIKTIGNDTIDNEFLAFDTIHHPLTSDDVSNNYFTEDWSKATAVKIIMMKGAHYIPGTSMVYTDQDWWSYNMENRIEYDGTTSKIRVDRLGGTWTADDVITIFIVYEK